MKWLAVTTITNVISRGYSSHRKRTTRRRASCASGQPIISAKATCIEGTAAYGLNSALIDALVWERFAGVRSATVSVNPHSGRKRGGAVGNSVQATSAGAHRRTA